MFIAFSGEEEGLLGSNYYVNNPIIPLANTVAMINMDMIGRMKSNKLNVGGVGTAQNWRDFIKSANAAEQMNVTASGEAAVGAPIVIDTSESARRPPQCTSANGEQSSRSTVETLRANAERRRIRPRIIVFLCQTDSVLFSGRHA